LKRRAEEGWDVIEDAGRGWWRVVSSPIPRRIIERDAIKNLKEALVTNPENLERALAGETGTRIVS
jgi:carbamate kinase